MHYVPLILNYIVSWKPLLNGIGWEVQSCHVRQGVHERGWRWVDTCLFAVWYCRGDKMTSVVIPLAMATTVGLMWARGMWNLYTGNGKLEWAGPVSSDAAFRVRAPRHLQASSYNAWIALWLGYVKSVRRLLCFGEQHFVLSVVLLLFCESHWLVYIL